MAYERPAAWQNPRILGVLLLVFLCGAASGALAMRYRMMRFVAAHQNGKLESAQGKEFALQHLKEELRLSPQQEQTIAQVLDDYVKYMQNVNSQMIDIKQMGKARIESVLDDEQKQKYERMINGVQKLGK